MHSTFLLLVSAIVGFASAAPINGRASAFEQQHTLRIMPLGASITMGFQSTDGNGYRKTLKDELTAQGQIVNMIGSRSDGNMYDNQDEGWSGFTIQEVQAKAEASLPKYLPNVVTLLVGTNDAKVATGESDQEMGNIMHDRLDGMIGTIYKHVPNAVVLVAKLPPNADSKVNARIAVYNSRIPDLVNAWAIGQKSGGTKKSIGWIDPSTVIGVEDLVDGTHPNDAAYIRLGTQWYEGIVRMRYLLQQPTPISAELRGIY